jgi:PQQ-like domain
MNRLAFLVCVLVTACGGQVPGPSPAVAKPEAQHVAELPACTRSNVAAGLRAALDWHAQRKFHKTAARVQEHLDELPTDEAAAALWRVTEVELRQARVEGANALKELTPIVLDDTIRLALPPAVKVATNLGGLSFGPSKVLDQPKARRRQGSSFDALIRDAALLGDDVPMELDGAKFSLGVQNGDVRAAAYIGRTTTIALLGFPDGGRRFTLRDARNLQMRQLAYASGLLILDRVGYAEQRVSVLTAFDARTGSLVWRQESNEDHRALTVDGAFVYLGVEVGDKGRLDVLESATGKVVRSSPVPAVPNQIRRSGGHLWIEPYGTERELLIDGQPVPGAELPKTESVRASSAETEQNQCWLEQGLVAIAKRDDGALGRIIDVLSPLTREHTMMDALREERKQLALRKKYISWQDAVIRPVPAAAAGQAPPAKKAGVQPISSIVLDDESTTVRGGDTDDSCREQDPCYFNPGDDTKPVPDVPDRLGNEPLAAVLPTQGRRLMIFGGRYLVLDDKQAGSPKAILDWIPDLTVQRPRLSSAAMASVQGKDVLAACMESGLLAAYSLADLTLLWQTRVDERACRLEVLADDQRVFSIGQDAQGQSRLLARSLESGAILFTKSLPGYALTMRVRGSKLRVFDTSGTRRFRKH